MAIQQQTRQSNDKSSEESVLVGPVKKKDYKLLESQLKASGVSFQDVDMLDGKKDGRLTFADVKMPDVVKMLEKVGSADPEKVNPAAVALVEQTALAILKHQGKSDVSAGRIDAIRGSRTIKAEKAVESSLGLESGPSVEDRLNSLRAMTSVVDGAQAPTAQVKDSSPDPAGETGKAHAAGGAPGSQSGPGDLPSGWTPEPEKTADIDGAKKGVLARWGDSISESVSGAYKSATERWNSFRSRYDL